MKRAGWIARLSGATVLLAAAAVPAGGQQMSEDGGIVGAWSGSLDAAGQVLRLVFHVERGEAGDLSGTMDSPDQGAYGLRLSSVSVEDGAVVFGMASIGGEYTGRLFADGSGMRGTWAQGGMTFPLELRRTDDAEVRPVRPQEPAEPYPYVAQDIVFNNPEAGIRLAGTLTLPSSGGPFPAVVLVSGSGPQDRDETVFGHRPFLVLADYLTRRGIAVLRYDDRGVGRSTGDFATGATPDFASDALAAVAYLRSRSDVDAGRIGVLGHSEGALVAPLVANRDSQVAFVVLLASSGVDGKALLEMQLIAINRAQGATEALVRARSNLQRRLLDVAVSSPEDSVVEAEARQILAEEGLTGAAADAQVRALLTPWMKHFLLYDPLPALRELRVPVLALNGEKDTQVPPSENLRPVEEALREGGNPDYTAEVLRGLNHMFQESDTGAPADYVRIEQTISPLALQRIGDWIVERVDPS